MAKAATFTDDFAIADGTKWWGFATGIVQATGSGLVLTPTSSYYPYLESLTSWDLTDSYFAFQLVSNADEGNGSITTELLAAVDGNNYVSVFFSGGDAGYVTFRERVAGTDSDTSVPFNPLRHKWFRIRHASGTVYWETSVDGATWVVRRSKATTLTLTSVLFRFVSGFWGTEPSPGTVTIDNVNLNTGTAVGVDEPLPASVLTDDFATESALRWYYPGGGFAASSGRLQCVPTSGFPFLVSSEPWNLTGSSFAVQLVQNANAGNGTISSEFAARIDADNGFKFIIPGGDGGALIMRESLAGVHSDISIPFKTALHKWFRFRQGAGKIHWEASRDGATWSTLRSKTSSLAVSSLFVFFTTGFYGTEPSPGTVVFDNFNIPNVVRLREIGWTIGASLPFGGIESGTVQQKVFFKDAAWLWEPIAKDPVLDPQSEAMVASLSLGQHPANTWDYGVTIVKPAQVNEYTPRYTFVLDNYPAWGPNPLTGFTVPIPDGTVVPPGSDGHLTVMDPITGKVFSFWQAYKAGAVWHASWAGVSDFHGDGRDYKGNATATELSRLAGVVLLNEIEAGEIPHALFFASDMAGASFRYPAKKSDGLNDAGVAVPIPEGARVQLDPDINLSSISGITPGELAVGRALQRYGAYCGDKGGSRAGFIFEYQGGVSPGASYVGAGFGWDYYDMTHIPWGSLRVLKKWDGSA